MQRSGTRYRRGWAAIMTAVVGLWSTGCNEDWECTAGVPLETVSVTISPDTAGEQLPAGAYALSTTLDSTTGRVTWRVDDQGTVTEMSVYQPDDMGWTVHHLVDDAGKMHVAIGISCPGKRLTSIDASLSLDGSDVDNASDVPTYHANQPTEPNGNGEQCGYCYRMNNTPLPLTVPVS